MVGKGKNGPVVHLETSIKLWELNLESKVDREFSQTPPERIAWTIARSTGGPIDGFWRLSGLEEGKKTLLIHGTTEDIRGMGMVPRAALRLEPNLEHGLLGAIETATLNSFRQRMEREAKK